MAILTSILKPISIVLSKMLIFFHDSLGLNYGLGIVLVTVILRLLLFRSSIKQARSMEKMKALQPKLREIQQKYGDDKNEVTRRTLELYRANDYKMRDGCLPLLWQLPFLLALFNLLNAPADYDITLANVRFLGLVLTDKGSTANILGNIPHLILAVISAGTTLLQQKIMSPTAAASTGSEADPSASMQSAFLYVMPLMIGYFTFTMAAAIGIYWVTQNIVGLLQQVIIVKFFLHPAKANALAGEAAAATVTTPARDGAVKSGSLRAATKPAGGGARKPSTSGGGRSKSKSGGGPSRPRRKS